MNGVIQKIQLSNYGSEYFLNPSALSFELEKDPANTNTVLLLYSFITSRQNVYDKFDQKYGANTIRTFFNSFKKNDSEYVFVFYKFTDDEWLFIKNSEEFQLFSEIREELFSILNWKNLGYKKVFSPIDSFIQPNSENNLFVVFQNFDDAEQIWNESTID
jgi:hypothetical protein